MSKSKEIPGPTLKRFLQVRKKNPSPATLFKVFSDEYDGIYKVNLPGNNFVHVSNPELIKDILQTNQKDYTKHKQYDALRKILGNGLVTSPDEVWKKQRKMIQPSFHKDKIKSFFDTMVGCTNQMISEWGEQLKKGDIIDFSSEMSATTLQIIGLTMLSTDVKKDKGVIEKALSMGGKMFMRKSMETIKTPLWYPTKTNRGLSETRKVLDGVLEKIITERKKTGNIKGDMLDMLMESTYEDDGTKMPDDLLRDEMKTIFVAGHETTSSALTWTFHYLTQHPKAMAKIKAEVDEVLGKKELQYEDLRSLKYTRACINESMRLTPPVWMVGKQAKKDTTLGDYIVKKNSDIFISINIPHRDPKYWENPDEFIPERWETEAVKKQHKYAYFPFGGGPRMCIGNNMALLEADIILAKIIQKFNFEYAGEKPPKVLYQITTNSKNGMPMKVKSNK